jgi:hypothetical protein
MGRRVQHGKEVANITWFRKAQEKIQEKKLKGFKEACRT